MNRRTDDFPALKRQYLDAGFTEDQATLLASKIIDRRKPWRREVLIVALLTIAFATGGWIKVGAVATDAQEAADDANAALSQAEAFASDLRDSAVSGCQRQNKVRKRQHEVQDIVRSMLKADNEQSRTLAPEDFPGLQHFNRLVRDQIERNQGFRRQLNHKLPLAACQDAYPSQQEGDT